MFQQYFFLKAHSLHIVLPVKIMPVGGSHATRQMQSRCWRKMNKLFFY